LLDTVPDTAVALDEVEPLESIVKRFSTQAMSLGSLSPEAHRTLALAMNQLGGRSNTGEGARIPIPIASSRPRPTRSSKSPRAFRSHRGLSRPRRRTRNQDAQGSKPGEGGQLPAKKVSEYIARIRHATPGTPLISPRRHHDIYSIEDLAQLIHDLRAVNPRARIGVNSFSGSGSGIIAAA